MSDQDTKNESMQIIGLLIHPSLIRPILLGGADRTFVLLNLTCIMLLVFGAGFHLITLLLALLLGLVGHRVLIKVAQYDPDFSRIYIRHLKYQDFYPALSSRLARAGSPQ